MNSLAFILDTARTNANTILADNKVKMSTHKFTYHLARALHRPSVQCQYNSTIGIRVNQMIKIKQYLSIKEELRLAVQQNEEEKGRCSVCVEELIGTASYKTKLVKLNNKLKVKCHSCQKFLCK